MSIISIFIAAKKTRKLNELQKILVDMGYSVAGACSASEEALEKIRSHGPDLVLIDADMPGTRDGISVCRDIRDNMDIPVVLMADQAMNGLISKALDSRPSGLLTRPFHAAQIKATLEMALARKARENEFSDLLEEYRNKATEKELFFALFDSSPLGLAVIGPKGKLIYTNKEFNNITGFNAKQVKGADRLLELLLPEKERRDNFVRAWIMDRCGHTQRLHEETIRCADGSEKIVEARTMFLTDGTGLMSISDITERRRTLEALKESEYKFRTVAQHTYDWEFWLSPDWKFIHSSPSCEGITGYPVSAFMERPELLFDIVFEEDRASLRQALEEAMYQSLNRRRDFRVRTRDGQVRWLSLTVQAVNGKQGETTGIRGSIRNITNRKNAEEALRLAEEKYRTIFEGIPAGILRSTPDGRLSEANPALAKMLGYDSPAHLLSRVRSIADDVYVHSEQREKVVKAVMATSETVDFEEEFYRADGTTISVLAKARMVRDAHGEPMFIEGTIEDITDRKKAEALREDVERMTRHDLRSPLISIIYGMRLFSSENLTRQQHRIAASIEDSCYRMLNMLNLSLNLYKMETGSYSLKPEPMDMVPLIRRITSELASEIQKKSCPWSSGFKACPSRRIRVSSFRARNCFATPCWAT